MPHRSYLLELDSPIRFRPKPFPRGDIVLSRALATEAARCRNLWTETGRGFWTERGQWTPSMWQAYLARPTIHFAIACIGREDVGFFELNREGDQVKLEGFGLLPAWRHHGLGSGLLSAATRQAFADGAKRIWLHTATDDHPHALPNYQARGYRIYHEETLAHPMPDQS